jgi:asparagine synthase (glutamine-hydrolysing)
MCGIAGIFHFSGSPVEKQEIDKLTDAVAHRGPDGRGTWFNKEADIAFGHRRLSILDTSEKGHQPMSYDQERYWITLNGEIYNFIEIRKELEQKGYVFQTETDTEVVLAAYKCWGPAMQHKFNGMWAFAIYDSKEKTLFLSRDRFGVKPLYYYTDQHTVYFSSEVQAIHRLLGKDHPLNRDVIADIVRGGFKSHGTIHTYLKDVYAIPGGYCLHIKDKELRIEEWYQLKKVSVPASFKKQAVALKELIKDACILRMRSDVPVATCLSGGLDSGSITAMISSYQPEKGSRFNNYTHKGFCAAFPDTPIDESKDALRLAKQLNSQIDVLPITPPSVAELTEAMRHCDGPMHALAFYPIFKLYQHIHQNNIIVTLDGQGPDEMLGGYRPLREAMDAAIELKKPIWLKDVYKTYASMGETNQFSSKAFARNELKLLFKRRSGTIRQGVKSMVKKALFYKSPEVIVNSDNLKKEFEPVRIPEVKINTFDKSLFSQFFQNPLPGILQQYDRCSMANGVECRMPFMDYRIVEFIFSLPVESKVGGGYTKRILRAAMKGLLPDETRLNKFKIGFNAPIVDWFRGELKEFMLQQMNSEAFLNTTYFDGKKLRTEFEAFLAKAEPNWNEAWKFWPPVHLTWWLQNNENVREQEV